MLNRHKEVQNRTREEFCIVKGIFRRKSDRRECDKAEMNIALVAQGRRLNEE